MLHPYKSELIREVYCVVYSVQRQIAVVLERINYKNVVDLQCHSKLFFDNEWIWYSACKAVEQHVLFISLCVFNVAAAAVTQDAWMVAVQNQPFKSQRCTLSARLRLEPIYTHL